MRTYLLAIGIVALCLCVVNAGHATTIQGVVVRDDSGAAIISAEVMVAREGQQRLEAHLETDSDGCFRADDLPEGRYTITVARPGLHDASLPVPADGTPLRVRLIQTSRIAGTLRWRDGRPMEHGRVFLMEKLRSGAMGLGPADASDEMASTSRTSATAISPSARAPCKWAASHRKRRFA